MKADQSTRARLQRVPAMALFATPFVASGQDADTTVTIPLQDGTAAANAATRVRSIDDRQKDIKYSGGGWTTFNPEPGWNNGTAKSSTSAKDFFEYTNPSCTRLKWFSTKSNSRGKADVYLDGKLKADEQGARDDAVADIDLLEARDFAARVRRRRLG